MNDLRERVRGIGHLRGMRSDADRSTYKHMPRSNGPVTAGDYDRQAQRRTVDRRCRRRTACAHVTRSQPFRREHRAQTLGGYLAARPWPRTTRCLFRGRAFVAPTALTAVWSPAPPHPARRGSTAFPSKKGSVPTTIVNTDEPNIQYSNPGATYHLCRQEDLRSEGHRQTNVANTFSTSRDCRQKLQSWCTWAKVDTLGCTNPAVNGTAAGLRWLKFDQCQTDYPAFGTERSIGPHARPPRVHRRPELPATPNSQRAGRSLGPTGRHSRSRPRSEAPTITSCASSPLCGVSSSLNGCESWGIH